MLRRRAMMRRPIARVGAAAVGTAVVVGTAGAVRHHQQNKYAQQDAAAQQQYDQAISKAQPMRRPSSMLHLRRSTQRQLSRRLRQI